MAHESLGAFLLRAFVPFVTAVASLIATVFLLFRLSSLDGTRRRRLLVRQLQHMAFSNLLYLTTEVFHEAVRMDWLVAVLGTPSRNPVIDQSTNSCRVEELLQDIGARASLLFELHMAAAFAASIFGAFKSMRFLYAALPYTWAVAILVGVVEVVRANIVWSPNDGCTGDPDVVYIAFCSAGFFACSACYIASSCGVSRAGGMVQRSVWRRIRLYPFVGLVTLCPFIVYFLGGPLTDDRPVGPFTRGEVAYLVAQTAFNANGLLTFLVYAWQTKYVRRGARSTRPSNIISYNVDSVPREVSFRVNFRVGDSVVETTNSSSDHTGSGDSLLLEYYDNSYHEAS